MGLFVNQVLESGIQIICAAVHERCDLAIQKHLKVGLIKIYGKESFGQSLGAFAVAALKGLALAMHTHTDTTRSHVKAFQSIEPWQSEGLATQGILSLSRALALEVG